jgi:SAM-dependent methyltransferase
MASSVFNIMRKIKRLGFKSSILKLKEKIGRKIKYKRIKNYRKIVRYLKNKKGLEIGGPSSIFSRLGYIPVYNQMKLLDGVNYSSSTLWTGTVDSENGFIIDGKNVGKLYITDATNVSILRNDYYDFILSSNNIEHIANPIKAVEQWLLKLKKKGIVIIVAPRKEVCFDHRRNTVTFEHLLEDYHKNTEESDLTHLEEILSLHDLEMDAPAGTFEQFKARSINNFENRCLHHHVFDLAVLECMYNFFHLKIIKEHQNENDYIIIGKK